ncbi:MAG: hypothetical protein ACFCBW_16045 [Candidatus Competibacterales bacterium]
MIAEIGRTGTIVGPRTRFGERQCQPSPQIGVRSIPDGTWVKGFICEPTALDRAMDITAHGDWRAYVASRGPPPHPRGVGNLTGPPAPPRPLGCRQRPSPPGSGGGPATPPGGRCSHSGR